MDPENHTLRLLIEMRAEIRDEMAASREEMAAFREEMREMRGEIGEVRGEVRELRTEMRERFDVSDKITRDTRSMVRMHGRMLRNLVASKDKHADRLDELERRRDR